MSVVHNQVCPGGSPAKCTNNNNFFFLLQYTMYSGDCGDGASHEMWQGQFDNIKPGISLVVQYCFDGTTPTACTPPPLSHTLYAWGHLMKHCGVTVFDYRI